MVKSLWNDNETPEKDTLAELRYRSNLIGADRSVCNWGGGNTSFKTVERDFKGNLIEVMWVKGSGSDLATMGEGNFTGLVLGDMLELKTRESMTDEEMVDYLEQCMISKKQPRPSIETLLHAFLPFKHVDHTHPDAIISICCSPNGQEIANQIWGDRFVWVPYIRPGFTLSKMIAEGVEQNPNAQLVLMEKHGLVVWGNSAYESYHKTIEVITQAEEYIQSIDTLGSESKVSLTISNDERKKLISAILPSVRGACSSFERVVTNVCISEDILSFINSSKAYELSQVGAACPDHLVHTKRVPLFVDWDGDVGTLEQQVNQGIHEYIESYKGYFQRYARKTDRMFNPSPRIILIRGLGMITTGKDMKAAKISEALYHRAVAVMEGSNKIGGFTSLSEEESFSIEYWPLELYKLSLAPPESEFSRQVAFVTGGAGGIGSATCKLLASKGAHVVIADLNIEGAQKLADEINELNSEGRAKAVYIDVTKEEYILQAIEETIFTFGGIDILVNNAGLATSSPLEETTLAEWNLNINVLGTGYFLVSKEAYKTMKKQQLGGSMIFVASKNSIYAGKNVTAYSAVKALEVHLARCIAAEGGDYGIRVNSVLPDAVLQGSNIWGSKWREERAAAYGIHPDELEEHYRKRTVLNENIYPIDIAEAIAFFASSKASKTTGCMLTVDGGVAAAFTR